MPNLFSLLGGNRFHCALFITLLLGQIAFTQPGGVLGHCPVEKQMIVPISANQHSYHSIPQQLNHPIWFALSGTIMCLSRCVQTFDWYCMYFADFCVLWTLF